MVNFLQKWLARALPSGPPVTWDYFMANQPEGISGITVDGSTALNHSPVWSGVFQLAGDVAKLPLNHHRILPNGGKQIFDGNGASLHYLLHDRPNPEMSSFKFRETMQALCILYGNAYAEIVRTTDGRVAGLYPLSPLRVQPVREERTGRLLYRVSQPSGGQAYVRPENMIHISSLSTDGIIGHSVTEHARESIGLGLATERFGAAFFGNGATFGGVVKVPMTLNGPQGEIVKSNIRSAIEAVHAGVDRAHKILVLAGGAEFTQRGTAPNEAQFLETRKFQIQEVSRWLVMPPHKLGDLENAHFTNIEESEIQYWKGTVHRWLKMWEQELKAKLIPSLERNLQSIDFNMEGELRGTSTQRAAFYKEMVGLGAYTINIVLEKEGLPGIGPAGDLHLVPLNMIPIERYGEYIDSMIQKSEPAPVLPPKDEDKPEELEGERVLQKVDEIRAATLALTEKVTAKLEQDVRAAQAVAETATAGQVSAEALATAAEAAKVAAEQVAQAAKDNEAAALVELADANAKLVSLQSQYDAVTGDVAEKQREIEAAVSDVAIKAAALSQAEAVALEQTEAARAAAERLVQAETEAQTRAADVARLTAELAAAEAARAHHERCAQEATAAHAAKVAEEQARMARAVTVHRDLVCDAIERFARVEVERARRRAQSPENLRKWADAFYDESKRDDCARSLVTAVKACLAWQGSDANPNDVARALADAYQAESVRQIQRLTDGMVGEEFQVAVTRMLDRWQHERPEMVADKVVRDEIAALIESR